MPLLVPLGVVSEPDPTPTPPVGPQPVVYWTSPDGEVTYFAAPGFRLLKGVTGVDMAPFQHYKDESPAKPGAFSRGHRALTRELFLPLDIKGANRIDFLDRKRKLLRDLDPDRGPGTLTWIERDSSTRHVDAFYKSGMEGSLDDNHNPTRQRYGLVLECLDSYWYGDEVTLQWQGAESQAFFPLVHSPTNFVNLVPSQVLGSNTVDNVGDVEAEALWDIRGPSTSITLENTTTGKTLTLNSTMTNTEHRIIDTRAGQLSIVDETGDNQWSELADGSALWRLKRGLNDLQITVAGSTGETLARLTYVPRFHSA